MFRSLSAALLFAATSAATISQHDSSSHPLNLAQTLASIGAAAENVEVTDPANTAFARIEDTLNELLTKVGVLEDFEATATAQLDALATDVETARSEAQVARAGKPKLVYYWTN